VSIADESELRALVPDPPAKAWEKESSEIDADSAAYIALSPFAVLATADEDGRCDASPRGGPPGFVAVLDPGRIALPDYTGNRRQDSHRNILANPFVGLVFFVPGVRETLRLNGRATLSSDARLLASLATGGAPPKLAIEVTVETVFVHCGKAPVRSGIWDPSSWPEGVSLAGARARNGETAEQVEARWASSYEDPAQIW
jgi:PPOX class probable FMN-dependent enzyme